MESPLVTVAIPSYNHAKYVGETIKSILNQSFQDFEIIITDDGSSDDTVAEIKKFTDPRIKLFTFEKNRGACNALNNCILHSKGKYFSYISSDDIWELNKLEKQVKFLDDNPNIEAVFSKTRTIDEKGNYFHDENNVFCSVFDKENRTREEWLNYFFFEGNCICHPSIMIRRRAYDEIGLYNENLANLPDFDMWVRLCLKHDIHILEDKLLIFRVLDNEKNASSGSVQNMARIRFEYKMILNHYLIYDVEFFSKIFPDAERYGKLTSELIPYFIGRIAIDSGLDFKQLWGLENIFSIMQSQELVKILDKKHGFTHSDFLKLSYELDVFKLIQINSLMKKNEKNEQELRKSKIKLENKNKFLTEQKTYLKNKTNNYKSRKSFKIADSINKLFKRNNSISKNKVIETNAKKISVIVTAYNHESYIKECLDSILNQKGNFKVEIIVGDDDSSDNTRKILESYKKTNSNIFIFPRKENVGITKNLKRCLDKADGKYIAICEGDDYWIDDYKLLKQAQFLDENQDCSFCFNSMLLKKNDFLNASPYQKELSTNKLTIRELIKKNFIGNFSTCMYREKIVKNIPDDLYEHFVVDWMFNIVNSEYGKIGFLDEKMSVYRIHDDGVWSGQSGNDKHEKLIECVNDYNKYLSFKYENEFKHFIKYYVAEMNESE